MTSVLNGELGIFNGGLVRIIKSSSGFDETMFPVVEKLQARRGPSDEAEIVIVNPSELLFSDLEDNGEGSYKVNYVSINNGRQSGTIYITKP